MLSKDSQLLPKLIMQKSLHQYFKNSDSLNNHKSHVLDYFIHIAWQTKHGRIQYSKKVVLNKGIIIVLDFVWFLYY